MSVKKLWCNWPHQPQSVACSSNAHHAIFHAWIAVAVGVLLLAAVPARADDGLQEIVVTAQRKQEKVQDVPVAITVISGADLETRRVRQAADIATVVPNMTVSSPYGGESQPTFALRGVTTNDFSENQGSPIAMYVDDVYKSVGAVQALQVYDLDRVEVLRGPQGTLYGKNATGGAVNFYSRDPSLSTYDGYATVSAGNYNAYSTRAAVGGPLINDELGWRAALMYDKRDGWLDSVLPGVKSLNGVDALAGRLTLLFKPSDDLAITLKVSSSRSGGTPYGVRVINVNPALTGFTGSFGEFQNGAKYAVDKDIRNDNATLKLEWQFAAHYTLTSVTGYDYGRWSQESDDGALPLADNGTPIRVNDPNTYFSSVSAFSQELRIASHDTGAFGWLAGGYYGRDTVHATVQYHFGDEFQGYAGYTSPQGAGLWGLDQYNSFDQMRDTKAAFLNATFTVVPTVTLRAGARYTKDNITIRNFYALGGGLAAAPQGIGPDDGTTLWSQTIPALPTTLQIFTPGLSARGAFAPELNDGTSNTSVKLGADWKPTDDVLAYFSFSQGYRGAAFNGQAFNNIYELNFARPETLDAYELGVKSSLWERRAEVNAAAFHYSYHDQQFLNTVTPPSGIGFALENLNAPKSRINGLELETRVRPVTDLEWRASIGLLDAIYQELGLAAGASGNRLVLAPKFTASASVDWKFAHLAAGDLRAVLDGNYYSLQYFDAANTQRVAQPGYGVANARVAFESANETHYAIAAWIKNIANRQYSVYGLAQQSLGFDTTLLGEPRMYGLEVSYRF